MKEGREGNDKKKKYDNRLSACMTREEREEPDVSACPDTCKHAPALALSHTYTQNHSEIHSVKDATFILHQLDTDRQKRNKSM